MSGVGTDWGSLDSAEEEFLKAVRKQSIGRPCVVRPSKNLVSPTERRLDGVRPSLRPVLTNNNYVDGGGPLRDTGFYSQTTPRGATAGKAEKEMMRMMAQIPATTVTVKAYARPAYSTPSTSRQINIGSRTTTTLTPSVMPLRLNPNKIQQQQQHQQEQHQQQQRQQQQRQQPKAVAASVTMATPTATSAHRLVPVPLSSPLQDLANRWARDLDAARERRKELRWQFRRDFGIGYGGHY